MSKTFEELATREIDGLYHGALFLSGGREAEAERLLMETLARSFHVFGSADTEDDIRGWLEGRLVTTFMERHWRPEQQGRKPRWSLPPAKREPSGEGPFGPVDADGLYRAAATVPWAARAALWLVLLRRWPYADASDVMGVERDVLRGLLEYRHTLMGAILGGRSPGMGGKSGTGT